MLNQLLISNYAIIDHLEVRFTDGMNVVTGETGAGKSVLLGALSLVLGERADTKVLLDAEKKCVVEAHFSPIEKSVYEFLGDDFDESETLILRREIAPNGKSRSFINDTPATLQQLKQVGELLVNMHSQHETTDLINRGFQFNVIDSFAGLKNEVRSFRLQFLEYRKQQKELESLLQMGEKNEQEIDYLKFQIDELGKANFQAGEQEELEQEFQSLSNVEQIKNALRQAIQILSENEFSALTSLSQSLSAIKPISTLSETFQKFYERLLSAKEDLNDLLRDIEHTEESTEADPARLEEVNQRLNLLYKLQKRHNVNSVAELLQLHSSFEEKLNAITNSDTKIEKLQQENSRLLSVLKKEAARLHKLRETNSAKAAETVRKLLHQVGMPNALFDIGISLLSEDKLNENGLSDIVFLFSANKGFAPKPLKEVASGGELSRLMLAIKSLLADSGQVPTLIFDEIDSGISGEVALRVGDIMAKIAKGHQLLCITHLPQIAAAGQSHFYVYKEMANGRTKTHVKQLGARERVNEIAQMIGGESYSETALKHANELLSTR